MFPPPGCTLFIWLHWVLAVVCGILVPRPGTEPESPSLQGEFLSTGSHRAVPLQGALWLCIGSWLGSQVIPLISEVQIPSCSQSTLREKVSLGMQSWPRGCPPPLGWPFRALGRTQHTDGSLALGRLVESGFFGQLKLPPSNTFYISKQWVNVCDPIVTGSSLLRFYCFQL